MIPTKRTYAHKHHKTYRDGFEQKSLGLRMGDDVQSFPSLLQPDSTQYKVVSAEHYKKDEFETKNTHTITAHTRYRTQKHKHINTHTAASTYVVLRLRVGTKVQKYLYGANHILSNRHV